LGQCAASFYPGNGMLVTNIHDMYSALTALPVVNFNPDKKALMLYILSSVCKPSQALAEATLNRLGVKYDMVDIGNNDHKTV